jgi:hypothetical protein
MTDIATQNNICVSDINNNKPLESNSNDLTSQYLSTLNARELKAYYIAKDHLGMSFSMERSNGFKQWKKTMESKPN